MVVTTGHTDMDTGEGKRGKLKLSQLLQPMLIPKLTLIPGIATMDMVLDIMVTTADLTMVVTTGHTDMDTGEEKRGKLKLSQLLQLMLMPKLTPIPGIATMDMVLDTMVTTADLTMVVTIGHTDMDTDTGEERRGKLKLNLKLTQRPMLIPGTVPMDMVLDTMDMVMDTTGHTVMDTEVMDTGARYLL